MQSILGTAKELLAPALHPGGTAADFTMGNGHDTLFLSRALPGGKVWAFDIRLRRWRLLGRFWRKTAPGITCS